MQFTPVQRPDGAGVQSSQDGGDRAELPPHHLHLLLPCHRHAAAVELLHQRERLLDVQVPDSEESELETKVHAKVRNHREGPYTRAFSKALSH